jgi:hypothetical protein
MQRKTTCTKLIAVSISCLALSSCSSSQDFSLNSAPYIDQPSATIGTNGELISIQSENVRAAGYDEASRIMSVQFDNGALYEYYGVPPDLWNSFVSAQPHPWTQVGYPRLVQGGIPYKRIN